MNAAHSMDNNNKHDINTPRAGDDTPSRVMSWSKTKMQNKWNEPLHDELDEDKP